MILATRPSDYLLWEWAPTLSSYQQALGGTLVARIQMRASAAAILNRYPSGMAQIGGTAMAVPAGY